jgi:hypothetical protein
MDGLLLTDNERRLMMETVIIELFADDLSEAGIQKFKDQDVWNDNWDIMPLAVMEFKVEESVVKKAKEKKNKKSDTTWIVPDFNNHTEPVIRCPFCQDPILANLFKDKLSIDEWTISGLCQKCQDEVFKISEE